MEERQSEGERKKERERERKREREKEKGGGEEEGERELLISRASTVLNDTWNMFCLTGSVNISYLQNNYRK